MLAAAKLKNPFNEGYSDFLCPPPPSVAEQKLGIFLRPF